jgi:hypothetical protein
MRYYACMVHHDHAHSMTTPLMQALKQCVLQQAQQHAANNSCQTAATARRVPALFKQLVSNGFIQRDRHTVLLIQ